MAVQHNRWSTLEHEGNTYRVRLVNVGWSYARPQIQFQTGVRKRWILFGSLVPKWSYIGGSDADHFPDSAFRRSEFYTAEWVKSLVIKACKRFPVGVYGAIHENKI